MLLFALHLIGLLKRAGSQPALKAPEGKDLRPCRRDLPRTQPQQGLAGDPWVDWLVTDERLDQVDLDLEPLERGVFQSATNTCNKWRMKCTVPGLGGGAEPTLMMSKWRTDTHPARAPTTGLGETGR